MRVGGVCCILFSRTCISGTSVAVSLFGLCFCCYRLCPATERQCLVLSMSCLFCSAQVGAMAHATCTASSVQTQAPLTRGGCTQRHHMFACHVLRTCAQYRISLSRFRGCLQEGGYCAAKALHHWGRVVRVVRVAQKRVPALATPCARTITDPHSILLIHLQPSDSAHNHSHEGSSALT